MKEEIKRKKGEKCKKKGGKEKKITLPVYYKLL